MSSNSSVGSGFSEGELRVASFWVRHGTSLMKSGRWLLIILIVLTWGYGLWSLLDAYVISYPRESRITSDIARNQLTMDALEHDRPQSIQSDSVLLFLTTEGRYDLAVDLDNPNEQWWVDFTYHFNLAGETTPLRSGFIMPSSKATVTELGYKMKNKGGGAAQFLVESLHWHRVDPAMVGPRYTDYQLNHFNVLFDKVEYVPNFSLGTKTVGRTSFDIINRGSFGYWSMDLIIKLYKGSTVVGINQVNVDHLVPGETRHMDLDWFDRIPLVTKTEIIPVINFLDPEAYLPTEQF